ncbi:MAG: PEP-utilizing enzyme [Candidatus Moranbacteria bacterium]|nr:PEP-utilizing enzyme [Candidatus Moranbacteria bacterium]
MKKNFFELIFTRDRQIITQYAWQDANRDGMEKLLKIKLPSRVGMVVYVNNGAIECWDSIDGVKFTERKVLEANKKNPEYLLNLIRRFDIKNEKYFLPTCRKETSSIIKIKEFIKKFDEYSALFAYIWISMLNPRTPAALLKKINEWRDKDDFFGLGSQFLDKSLENIYPELKGLTSYIMKEEVENPPSIDILKKRQRNFLRVSRKSPEIISMEKFAKKRKDMIFLFPEIVARKKILGQTGCKGNIRGTVKVLRTKAEIGKVNRGDIIVSPMSVPEFIPAMKKAAAIITDEGGFLCHAAVVSRELKKPCVIGTKIATKVLKDGDLVEVDADKGIVRIIK